jgi:hypothetical protein
LWATEDGLLDENNVEKSMRRNRLINVVGIYCSILGVVMLVLVSKKILGLMEFGIDASKYDILFFICTIVMIIAGVGVTQKRAWGRKLAIVVLFSVGGLALMNPYVRNHPHILRTVIFQIILLIFPPLFLLFFPGTK